MTRFQQSFRCLNGPKIGDFVDAPAGVAAGSAVAVPWFGAGGILRYAVYVVTDFKGPEQTDEQGLMFVQSHDKPERAQDHVHRLALTFKAVQHMDAN